MEEIESELQLLACEQIEASVDGYYQHLEDEYLIATFWTNTGPGFDQMLGERV